MSNILPKDYVHRAARQTPNKTAVIFKDQSLTFRELASSIDAVANQLKDAGVRPGDYVLVPMAMSLLFEVIFFAVARNNAIIFLVPSDAQPQEMLNILGGVGINFAIIQKDADIPALAEIKQSVGRLLEVCQTDHGSDITLIHQNPNHSQPAPESASKTDGRYMVRMMSSGSTGKYKHILRTGESLTRMCQSLEQAYGITSDDRILNAVPPYHIIGNGLIALAACLGVTIILEDKFVPAAVLDDIEHHRATMMLASPFVFDILARSMADGHCDMSSLRLAISGGAPLTEEVYTKVRQQCKIPLHEMYGSTEVTVATVRLDSGVFENGMVGIPAPGVTIKIFDDTMKELPTGHIGNVGIASPMVVECYFDGVRPNRNGFYNSFALVGDSGFLDERGRLHVVGRSNLIINIGGRKVTVSEIENIVRAHPAVSEVAVYGVAQNNTEVVAAAVCTKSPVTSEALMEWCRERLSAYKVPKHIIFVEELPRNKVGKILRSALPVFKA